MRRFIWIVFIAVTSASLALADAIILKDGTRLEGEVRKTPNGWSVKTADGKVVEVPADKVKSMELGETPVRDSPLPAQVNLASLRRSVENAADINVVIERYNRFIEQNKDTPVAEEAENDLFVWRDRLDRGLVKYGEDWITPDERAQLTNQALAVSDQARKLIAGGRHNEGSALIHKALASEPQCSPALYLRGVIEYQDNKLPAARKSFEVVAAKLVDHAPSLNNIAVIHWWQNARIPALSHYDKSITASPGDKVILDNVAEALSALSMDQRKNRIAQTLLRKFTEQDNRLQEVMAVKGLYRWGGSWIDEEANRKLRDHEKQINDQVAGVLEAELESVRGRIFNIEDNTLARHKQMARMPYPPVYFDLKKEEKRLDFERAALIMNVEYADAEVRRLQAQLPQPKFTGIQQLIGVEGMPVIPFDPIQPAPEQTIQPSTVPSKD